MAILRLLLGPSKRTASASNQDRRVESKCASLCVYGRIMEGQWNTRGHGPWAVRRQAVRQTSAFQTTMVTSTLRQSAVQRASASRRESQTKLSYVLDLRIQNTEQGGQGDFICKGEHQEGKSLSGGRGDLQGFLGGFSWSVQSSSTKVLEKLKGSVWNSNRTKDRKALTCETGSSLKWIIKKSQWEKITNHAKKQAYTAPNEEKTQPLELIPKDMESRISRQWNKKQNSIVTVYQTFQKLEGKLNMCQAET